MNETIELKKGEMIIIKGNKFQLEEDIKLNGRKVGFNYGGVNL